MKITISLAKANIRRPAAASLDLLRKDLGKEKGKAIVDYRIIGRAGDARLLMTHEHGVNSKEIRSLLHDTLPDGLPDVCELEIAERDEEAFVVFMLNKAETSAANRALYDVFANPLSTTGLVADPKLREGFKFEVHDVGRTHKIILDSPEETYDLLALISLTDTYHVAQVYKNDGTPAAAVSAEMSNMVVRAQSGFPAICAVVDPFAKMNKKTRGMALAFSIKDGKLSEPANVFKKPPPPNGKYPVSERVMEELRGRFRKIK